MASVHLFTLKTEPAAWCSGSPTRGWCGAGVREVAHWHGDVVERGEGDTFTLAMLKSKIIAGKRTHTLEEWFPTRVQRNPRGSTEHWGFYGHWGFHGTLGRVPRSTGGSTGHWGFHETLGGFHGTLGVPRNTGGVPRSTGGSTEHWGLHETLGGSARICKSLRNIQLATVLESSKKLNRLRF